MTNLKASFSAADSIPSKLLVNNGVKELLPIHVQWLPTNKCNLNCKFCSCADRDKNQSMDIVKATGIIQELSSLGCKAVTITGGGEPLCHPDITEMIQCFAYHNISIGLVTNGTLLDHLDQNTLGLITWCRISHSDERELTPRYEALLEKVIENNPLVDWAFSYVVTDQTNTLNVAEIVEFANDYKFTHVRLVADLFNTDNIDFGKIREALEGTDSRVIYQPRNHPRPADTCAIGYVKPVVAPDFRMYLCCGVQYALEKPSKDLPKQLSMGMATNLSEIYGPDRKLFHTQCKTCYYDNYNAVLRPLLEGVQHGEFL